MAGTSLKEMADSFGGSPGAMGRELRNLVDRKPERFAMDAAGILIGWQGSAGEQYVLTLLASRALLILVLIDVCGRLETLPEGLLAAALKVEPQLGKMLGRLARQTGYSPGALRLLKEAAKHPALVVYLPKGIEAMT